MKSLSTNMHIHMMIRIIYTPTMSCPLGNTAIGIDTKQRVMNTRMCRMHITCTLIER